MSNQPGPMMMGRTNQGCFNSGWSSPNHSSWSPGPPGKSLASMLERYRIANFTKMFTTGGSWNHRGNMNSVGRGTGVNSGASSIAMAQASAAAMAQKHKLFGSSPNPVYLTPHQQFLQNR